MAVLEGINKENKINLSLFDLMDGKNAHFNFETQDLGVHCPNVVLIAKTDWQSLTF